MENSSTGRARVEIVLPVELSGQGVTDAARTSDISLGGCYIESGQPVRVESRIVFRLQLPSGRWLMMTGEVTHAREGSGFGVRFVGLADVTRTALTQLSLIHISEPTRPY